MNQMHQKGLQGQYTINCSKCIMPLLRPLIFIKGCKPFKGKGNIKIKYNSHYHILFDSYLLLNIFYLYLTFI